MIVAYDGNFESFLTLIYEVYYSQLQVTQIQKELPKSLFLDDIIQIEVDEQKALKVLKALEEKFQKEYFETIFNIFMCDSVEFEMDLLHYIILGFKDQKELNNINNSCGFNIQKRQRELFRMGHKMTGFVRFIELEEGTLYAKVETKFNIVYFLGKHFLKRLNNQNFIIHDIKRELAFIKSDSFTGMQSVASFDIPQYSKDEEKFQKLWKTFFDSVAIESRRNEKLQSQWVPLIHRVYMNEFN